MRINFLARLCLYFVIACVLAMIGYQVYLKASAPYKTTEAKEVTVRDSYSTTALVLRDEKVIPMVNRGTVSYLFDDVYEAFVSGLPSTLNEKIWDEITLVTDGSIVTDDFFSTVEEAMD